METLVETSQLKISFEAGTEGTDEAIIAFTGVGLGLGGIQKEEFVRSLQQKGLLRDTYYVIDKTRSWYNSSSPDITAFFESELLNKRVITLGNSMGGFGALLFSDLISGCNTAIAFCPQYSVHKDIVPFETRWRDYISNISTWTSPCCLDRQKKVAVKLYFLELIAILIYSIVSYLRSTRIMNYAFL